MIPFSQYLRPGFPTLSNTAGGQSLYFEYIAPSGIIAAPKDGDSWGDVLGKVSSATQDPAQKSGYDVTGVTVTFTNGEGSTIGSVTEVAYELEWVAISRPLKEHPEFREGGASALTADDRLDIIYWIAEPASAEKREFKFFNRNADGDKTGSAVTLSANAQKAAKFILLGVETYTDFAPVARKNSTYTGGPPNAASAGNKENLPAGFPNPPSGYEWLKTADRSNRAAGTRKWQRTEEWTGASKVLVDNDSLYYP